MGNKAKITKLRKKVKRLSDQVDKLAAAGPPPAAATAPAVPAKPAGARSGPKQAPRRAPRAPSASAGEPVQP